MTSLIKLAIAAAVAASTLVSAESVSAMSTSMPRPAVDARTDVTEVYWATRCGPYRCRRVWVGPRVIYRPRVIVRPRFVEPRVIVRRPGGRHVNWCLNRYRSYEPSTNTYIGYDGVERTCVSPFW